MLRTYLHLFDNLRLFRTQLFASDLPRDRDILLDLSPEHYFDGSHTP